MPARSTRHHTLLHNSTIIHTKTFFAPACHPHKKILSTSKYDSKTNSSGNISLFPYLGLGLELRLRLWLRSNHPRSCNRYKSLYATTLVASYFYFYVLCNYYHTHENRGVLDNPYYSQVLHTNKYGIVLGTPIQDSQHEITLREPRMIFLL